MISHNNYSVHLALFPPILLGIIINYSAVPYYKASVFPKSSTRRTLKFLISLTFYPIHSSNVYLWEIYDHSSTIQPQIAWASYIIEWKKYHIFQGTRALHSTVIILNPPTKRLDVVNCMIRKKASELHESLSNFSYHSICTGTIFAELFLLTAFPSL